MDGWMDRYIKNIWLMFSSKADKTEAMPLDGNCLCLRVVSAGLTAATETGGCSRARRSWALRDHIFELL